jgi:hypothetical protein
MHTETASHTHQDDWPVDPWAFLAGGSVGIVVGFAVDLLRLGVHEARQALAARSGNERVATRGWRCPGTCDAGAR